MPEPSPMKVYPDSYELPAGEREPLSYARPSQAPVSSASWYAFGIFGGLLMCAGLGMITGGFCFALGARGEWPIPLGFGVGFFCYGLILVGLPIVRHRMLTQHILTDR